MIGLGICVALLLFPILLWSGGCAALFALFSLGSTMSDIDTVSDSTISPSFRNERGETESPSTQTIAKQKLADETARKLKDVEREYADEIARKQGDVERYRLLLGKAEETLKAARQELPSPAQVKATQESLKGEQGNLEGELEIIDKDMERLKKVIAEAKSGKGSFEYIGGVKVRELVVADPIEKLNTRSSWHRELRKELHDLTVRKIKTETEMESIEGQLRELSNQLENEETARKLKRLNELDDQVHNYRKYLATAQERVQEVELKVLEKVYAIYHQEKRN